jgi:hypothetical protein
MVTGYLIGLYLGVMIGAAFTFVICHIPKRRIGTLRVDQSDPNDEPYLFLELSVPVDVVKQQKRVMLDVNVENYLSQK